MAYSRINQAKEYLQEIKDLVDNPDIHITSDFDLYSLSKTKDYIKAFILKNKPKHNNSNMKTKITITVLILISIIIGCSSKSKASGSVNNSTCVYVDGEHCQVHLIKVRGHEYLVSYTSSNYGGTCIIHAAHCQCNNH